MSNYGKFIARGLPGKDRKRFQANGFVNDRHRQVVLGRIEAETRRKEIFGDRLDN